MQAQKPKARSQKLLPPLHPPYELITPPPPSYLKRGCRRQGCYFKGRVSGFTLIEIVMIIVVVSIAIPTLLIVLGQGARQGVNAELEVSATNVAQALMEEIRSKRWDENNPPPPYTTPLGPEVGAGETWNINHSNYDDVDDYNNLYANSTGGNSDFLTIGGVRYNRDCAVCYVQAAALDTCVTPPTTTDYKRIQVTVTNATLGSVNLVTVVTNY